MPNVSDQPYELRSFLDYASGLDVGQYLAIDKRISPRFETTAVVSGLVKRLRSPVIRFGRVDGCALPMVTNICSSFERVAKSVGISGEDLNARLQDAHQGGPGWREVSSAAAPVQSIVRGRDAFSLSEFPALYYSASQTAPYITAAIVVARDPDSGAHNLSFHRLMISSDHEAGIYMTPRGHLEQIWQRNRAAGASTPIAAVIGTHPLWCYAALVAGALDHDDYAVVGAVSQQAIDLVSTRNEPDLKVPAFAEIVLEGQIDADATVLEGPFGEFLGFEAEQCARPLVRFSTLTSREEPIYQDIVAGQIEHMTMSSVSLRARLQRDYFIAHAAVVDFWLPAGLTLFLAIDSDREEGFGAEALMRELLEKERFLKQVVCFDAGTNLRKLADVQAAMANFVQADRDIFVIDDCDGNGVDPSEVDGKTAKMAIDARAKSNVVRAEFPTEFLQQFDLTDWL